MTQQLNYFLSSLAPADLALIQPHLKLVQIAQEKLLFDQGDQVNAVYFPTTAIISLVVVLSTGKSVEAAMCGRDGAVALFSALDGNISLYRAVVELSGHTYTCNADRLKAAISKSPSLVSSLIRHEQTQYAQSQQSTACMASHGVEARLSRCLLRARDLTGSDVLELTQDYLGEMLGVRRTSISEVAMALQQRGLISYSRGKMKITDAAGLRDAACECYAAIRTHYEDLIGKTYDDASLR